MKSLSGLRILNLVHFDRLSRLLYSCHVLYAIRGIRIEERIHKDELAL